MADLIGHLFLFRRFPVGAGNDGFRFCHGLRTLGKVVALDDGDPFRLKVVLFLRALLGGLVQNLRELYVNLLRGFLELKVLAELFVKFRKILIRNLHVGIGILNAGSLGIKEVHQGVKPDIELLDKFR